MKNIEIVELSEKQEERTVGQIVKENYRKAEVFKKYGIDFCCGGKKLLSAVCKEKGINSDLIIKELNDTETRDSLKSQDFDSWNLDTLADYIVNMHHKYVLRTNPILFSYLQKVAGVHHLQHPELIEIQELFVDVMNELNQHMMKEENVLFPYIKELVVAQQNNTPPPNARFGTILNPIEMMIAEHEDVHLMMDRIKSLTNNYITPQDACNSFLICFSYLKEFETDLYKHIHLENNILFPKALQIENELRNK